MSCPNFNLRHNTKNIYAFNMFCDWQKYLQQCKQDGEEVTEDDEAAFYFWSQDESDYYTEWINEELTAKFGKNAVYQPTDRRALAIIDNSFYFADHYIQCKISLQIESGNYEGFTIDWQLDGILDGYFDEIPTEEDCADHLEADTRFYSTRNEGGLNKGLAKMLAPKLLKRLTDQINQTTDQIEEILATVAPHKLGCSALFSNGEAIYTEVA